MLELVTFPELDVQGPGHLVEVPADSSKLPARFPYGVHFFISEDRHPVQRPQSFRHCCKVSDEAAFCLIQRH
ncbi:hypothetical protein F8D12_23925 [Klebsiella pneumoniae]|nr:hypothetical protein F8D12_23925 [Klebsiella pneumoniae]